MASSQQFSVYSNISSVWSVGQLPLHFDTSYKNNFNSSNAIANGEAKITFSNLPSSTRINLIRGTPTRKSSMFARKPFLLFLPLYHSPAYNPGISVSRDHIHKESPSTTCRLLSKAQIRRFYLIDLLRTANHNWLIDWWLCLLRITHDSKHKLLINLWPSYTIHIDHNEKDGGMYILQNALRASRLNEWIKMTRKPLTIRNFSATKKLTPCLMSVLQKNSIRRLFVIFFVMVNFIGSKQVSSKITDPGLHTTNSE